MANGPAIMKRQSDGPAKRVLVGCRRCVTKKTPIVTEPNERLAGETETAVTGAAPVPARLTGYTLPSALMVSVPVALPPTTGANVTKMSQCVPGAMTPFQLPLATQ